jgi:hypothetical protein
MDFKGDTSPEHDLLRRKKKPSIFYYILNNTTSVKERLRRQNSAAINRLVSSASVLDVFVGTWQRSVVDESGMIVNQMGTNNRSEMIAVHGSLYARQPGRSNEMLSKFGASLR